MSALRKFVAASVIAGASLVALDASAAKDSYVTLGLGMFDSGADFTDFGNKHDSSLEYRLEYRGSEFWHGLLPTFGVESNLDGGTYGFLGLAYDYQINDSFYVMPIFSPGYYYEGGSKDLGGELEFRSSLEVGYQMPGKSRIGVAISHISNASIYEHNPGENEFSVTYSMPFSYFTRP